MANKGFSRYIHHAILNLALNRKKMAFLSGPRQVGKTTFSKSLEPTVQDFEYVNWDDTAAKRLWSKDPSQLFQHWDLARSGRRRLLVLDEIHKSKGWKSKIKGLYDVEGENIQILVTGSARLNIYRKGSDSLLGRYFHFRLHPFSIREILGLAPKTPDEFFQDLFSAGDLKKIDHKVMTQMENLYQFSGFPEPLFSRDKKILQLWKKSRKEKIIREDLRDLSRIHEISQVEVLSALLPEKVGSPLSIQSLREDLLVAHDTVSRWLLNLKELYYHFDIAPYSKSIRRSLKKDVKIYFFDWTECETDGQRFENLVASHLLKSCHYWEDTGEGTFALHYLRDKEKNEVDFLVLKDRKPWFTVECKWKDTSLDLSYRKFQKQLGCPHIQVVYDSGVFRRVDSQTYIMGVDRLLEGLV